MNLEQNPTNPENQAELAAKKKKLKDLETKQKQLEQQLPLTVQINNLEREIKELSNKSARTQAEEALLTSKKKELAELLKNQNSSTNAAGSSDKNDKTGLYISLGIIGVVLILGFFVFLRKHKKRSI